MGLFLELLDPDMILNPDNIKTMETPEAAAEEEEEEDLEGGGTREVNVALCIVHQLVQDQGLVLLIQNLQRLDEGVEEDSLGVHNTLNICENLLEILPTSMPATLCSTTPILGYLTQRLQARPIDRNKLYASEILSILLQGQGLDPSNVYRYCGMRAMDGVECLLQGIHAARKQPAVDGEELECISNLFLCLSSILSLPSNQPR